MEYCVVIVIVSLFAVRGIMKMLKLLFFVFASAFLSSCYLCAVNEAGTKVIAQTPVVEQVEAETKVIAQSPVVKVEAAPVQEEKALAKADPAQEEAEPKAPILAKADPAQEEEEFDFEKFAEYANKLKAGEFDKKSA